MMLTDSVDLMVSLSNHEGLARSFPPTGVPSGLTRGPLATCTVLKVTLGSSPRERLWIWRNEEQKP